MIPQDETNLTNEHVAYASHTRTLHRRPVDCRCGGVPDVVFPFDRRLYSGVGAAGDHLQTAGRPSGAAADTGLAPSPLGGGAGDADPDLGALRRGVYALRPAGLRQTLPVRYARLRFGAPFRRGADRPYAGVSPRSVRPARRTFFADRFADPVVQEHLRLRYDQYGLFVDRQSDALGRDRLLFGLVHHLFLPQRRRVVPVDAQSTLP